MYHVFAAETAGADGDLETAATEYVTAAMKSDNPEIARRATAVAVAAQTWQLASMAADRWSFLEPKNIEAQETAARAMLVVGDYAAAEHVMEGILDLLPEDPLHAWTIIAGLLGPSVDPDKANELIQVLIDDRQVGDTAAAWFARSQLSARKGEFPEALEQAGKAIAKAPKEAGLQAWAGRLSVNLDDPEAALDHFKKAWQLDPGNLNLAISYAELLKRQNQGQQADEVLAGLPDSPDLRFTRISFALDLKNSELATRLYEGFDGAKYPDASAAAFYAGQSAEMLDKTDEALTWYQQVTSGRHELLAVLRSAYLLADQHKVDAARQLLENARRKLGDDQQVETWLAESQILLDADQPDQAFEVANQSLSLFPDDEQLRYSRALAAVALNRLDEAEQDFRRIIDEDPQNASALNALGYTLADRTKRYDEAEKLIREAFKLQPDEPSIIDSMGWVEYRLGHLDEAERYLRSAYAGDRNPEIAAHLGEVLWVAGKQDEARAIWKDGMAQAADNKILIETMKRFGFEP